MKRSKAQLNAISRHYQKKEAAALEARATSTGMDAVFPNQTAYKTLRGLLEAKPAKQLIVVKEALDALKARRESLERCGCNSEKYTDCLAQLAKVENVLDSLSEPIA